MRVRLSLSLLTCAAILLAAPPSGPASDKYGAVDGYARAAPASAAASVESLARYLRQGARDEEQSARAAFTWIAHNVAYERALRNKSDDAARVLAGRRAACYGHAVLFEALVEAMGLEAEIILGHGKGRGYQPGEGMESAEDHAWNAVKIGGKWGLVDSTWGAGYLDEQGRFVRRFTDHYFLTPPEKFAYDHFPDDARWQLLPTPVTKEQYLNRPTVKPPFFELGLSLMSHHSARIEVGSGLEVTVGAPRETILTAALYQTGKELDRRYAFAQREASGFVLRAAFPSRGSYLLRVFARQRNAMGQSYETALEYAVEARAGAGERAGFPEMYESFQLRECRLEAPLGREIPAGERVRFSLMAPEAEEMVVVRSDEVWWVLSKRGTWFSGEVLTEPGPITVFARYPGKRRHEGLLKYLVR